MKLHALVAEPETARMAVEGGATVVQWRLKGVPTLEVVERGRSTRSLCARHGVAFVVNDDVEAAAEALAAFGVAGEEAARAAEGPGSFHVNLYDALAALDPDTLDEKTRIS
jgi:thiamine monophosphate synthase